jgi:hypothetical protein
MREEGQMGRIDPAIRPGTACRTYRVPRSGLVQLRLWKCWHNRKNSLFVGNPRGGRTAAILASLTSTSRRHDVDPQLYLTQLFTNLSQVRKSELPNWLPDQWKLRQAAGFHWLQTPATRLS